MIIRKEQMDVLGRYMVEQFVERSLMYLRTAFNEQMEDDSDEKLRIVIQEGIEKAKSYGIKYERDVLHFLEFTMRYGTDFDKDPQFFEAAEILKQEIDGTAKITLLSAYIQSNHKELPWAEK